MTGLRLFLSLISLYFQKAIIIVQPVSFQLFYEVIFTDVTCVQNLQWQCQYE